MDKLRVDDSYRNERFVLLSQFCVKLNRVLSYILRVNGIGTCDNWKELTHLPSM